MWNKTKTLVLMAALTALTLTVGQALGGGNGLIVALVVAGLMNLGSYWFSDRIILRAYRAEEVTAQSAPDLYRAVHNLAHRAGIPVPRVYVIPETAPNAFATGRNPDHAAVAVTRGLLQLLTRRELTGVLAHELAHIRNRDTLIMTVAASVAGAIGMLANMFAWGAMLGQNRSNEDSRSNPLAGLLGLIVAPIAASLIQMAISRNREYIADESAAELTGDPLALAQALRKIERWGRSESLEAAPATAHLFIINPLSGGRVASWFSTHPPTESRVRRLESMLQVIAA
jgi:heat shock protein HtpX